MRQKLIGFGYPRPARDEEWRGHRIHLVEQAGTVDAEGKRMAHAARTGNIVCSSESHVVAQYGAAHRHPAYRSMEAAPARPPPAMPGGYWAILGSCKSAIYRRVLAPLPYGYRRG